MLNIFYQEPENDRWVPFDRFPRRLIRRIARGRPQPSGQTRVFLNLRAGLERLAVPYRLNSFRYIEKNPREIACIIGKSFVLDQINWKNPIVLGSSLTTHPLDDPNLLKRLPVKKILVPGPWLRDMCQRFWGDAVEAWPVGVDTDLWKPDESIPKNFDVLLYDKVRWDHDDYESSLIGPIRAVLKSHGLSVLELRYGSYKEQEFYNALRQCRTMIFLCEHETQGIAYQQALSCDVPIFAWDRGGPWRDPEFFPHRIVFEPVTSVPYWDERCGIRFVNFSDFRDKWSSFWRDAAARRFHPRNYILENLTLEKCTKDYLQIVQSVNVNQGY